jgi:hypothetical protein
MSDSTLRIEYALAKQVPEIARVARFDTAYGELRLTGWRRSEGRGPCIEVATHQTHDCSRL